MRGVDNDKQRGDMYLTVYGFMIILNGGFYGKCDKNDKNDVSKMSLSLEVQNLRITIHCFEYIPNLDYLAYYIQLRLRLDPSPSR